MSRGIYAIPKPNSSEAVPAPVVVSNLPAQATSFVGRKSELAAATVLLNGPHVRLLTLTGAPGIGKTRIGIELAAQVAPYFPDGLYFVPLAAVTRPDEVAPTVARVLGLQLKSRSSVQARLQNWLREKRVLLFLDNLEQVEEPAPFVASLLAAGPGVKVLVTSRTLLHVYGEHELHVPSMALPDLRNLSDIQALSHTEAVSLFVHRARAIRADFKLTTLNAEAVARLCIALDGLPLAIELAAARTRVTSPQLMLPKLEQRLDFLKGGPHDHPSRHQTLRAAISWSYDLLTPAEQDLFAKLAVFSGGCTAPAVEAICGDAPTQASGAPSISDLLESLVNKSLVICTPQESGECRFALLETVRVYALERLNESSKLAELEQRHAVYYLDLAEQGSGGREWAAWKTHMARLDGERDNLRAAQDCLAASEMPASADLGLRLANALVLWWRMRGYLVEARERLSMALQRREQAENRVMLGRVLCQLGQVHSLFEAQEEAIRCIEEGLDFFRQVGNQKLAAFFLGSLGHARIHLGDTQGANACYTQMLALAEAAGDQQGIANSYFALADLALHRGDAQKGRELLEKAIPLARKTDNRSTLSAGLRALSHISSEQRLYSEAIAMACESLEISLDIELSLGVAYSLGVLGKASYAQGHFERAVEVFSAAWTLFDSYDQHMEPYVHTDAAEYDRSVEELRDKLGDAEFTAAWDRGRNRSADEILQQYRAVEVSQAAGKQVGSSGDGAPGRSGLTPRELEVLRLVALGMTNGEVATRLTITSHTVNMHLRSIYSKLGVATRSGATRFAIGNRLI